MLILLVRLDEVYHEEGLVAKQCLNVLCQLGQIGLLMLHVLQELDGIWLLCASTALHTYGCVIYRSDFNTSCCCYNVQIYHLQKE